MTYNPDTGVFTRNKTAGRCLAGSVCGTPNSDKHIVIKVDYVQYAAHRLAFLYMTGEWPKEQVDHINCNRQDNRWTNLRDVSASINQQNRHNERYNSSTGYIGVTVSKSGRYQAQIEKGGKTYYLGLFDTAKEAHEAYMNKKKELHPEAFTLEA